MTYDAEILRDAIRDLTQVLDELKSTLTTPAAGACPSYLRVGLVFPDTPDEHVYCQHPHRHSGLHSNNPDQHPNQFEARWTDWAEGAKRLDEEQP